jgi:carbonic anhydrase
MNALLDGRERVAAPNLRQWLRHGEPSLARLRDGVGELSRVNQLSQLNVLEQLEHMRSYPIVRERLADHRLKLHGWWFELSTANVYTYDERAARFILVE